MWYVVKVGADTVRKKCNGGDILDPISIPYTDYNGAGTGTYVDVYTVPQDGIALIEFCGNHRGNQYLDWVKIALNKTEVGSYWRSSDRNGAYATALVRVQTGDIVSAIIQNNAHTGITNWGGKITMIA